MAALTGYNSNVRHRGRIFHIQTEDSGGGHQRVITHLFADGGRIVKSSRSEYSEYMDAPNLPELVRGIMKDQHKAMFVLLRSGGLDAQIGFDESDPPMTVGRPSRSGTFELEAPEPAVTERSPRPLPNEPSQVSIRSANPPSSGTERMYASPRPASIFSTPPSPSGLFGERAIEERSLDEAILEYLADAGPPSIAK